MSKAYKKPEIWSQLKSKTSIEIKKALDKDPDWILIKTDGARHFYENSNGDMVEIHVHPSNKSGYGEYQLKSILDVIGWSQEDMAALKLIKLKGKKKK